MSSPPAAIPIRVWLGLWFLMIHPIQDPDFSLGIEKPVISRSKLHLNHSKKFSRELVKVEDFWEKNGYVRKSLSIFMAHLRARYPRGQLFTSRSGCLLRISVQFVTQSMSKFTRNLELPLGWRKMIMDVDGFDASISERCG
jgi:hypothetical protein